MTYHIQDESDNEFHSEELVLWHASDNKRSLPIPAVVVRQLEHDVLIRTCNGGSMREVAVPPEELVKR